MPLSKLLRSVAATGKQIIPGSTREWLRYRVLKSARRLHRRRFHIGAEPYEYLFHDYNKAWTCERTVEVPVAIRMLERFRSRRVLEVGNVLSHYLPTSHVVVDKYELAPGVMNTDVVDLDSAGQYDLIITISTLEHVGFDEPVKEPQKILTALARLRACLAPGGTLLVTLPLNYNLELDGYLRARKIRFATEHYLERVSAFNDWRETTRETAMTRQYGYPYVGANGLLIGFDRA